MKKIITLAMAVFFALAMFAAGTITLTGLVTGQTYDFGSITPNTGQSQQLSFTIQGTALTTATTYILTAPAGYQLSSVSGGPYTPTLSYPTGAGTTIALSPVYVVFKPTSIATFNGSFTTANVSPAVTTVTSTVTFTGNGLANNFTAGNLIVERIGFPSTVAATSAATPVLLDEYTTAGSYVQSLLLAPMVSSATVCKMTESGTATSNGYANISNDGSKLMVTGYDFAYPTAGVNASNANRVIAKIDNTRAISTYPMAIFPANNIRSVVDNCNNAWISGSSAAGVSGAYNASWASGSYTTAQAATGVSPTTAINLRNSLIFNNQYMYSSGAAATLGITALDIGANGLPTASATATIIINASTAIRAGQTTPNTFSISSPYGFVMFNLPGNGVVCYVADDANGILKFVCSSSAITVPANWSFSGKIATTCRGITGAMNGANVTLYITDAAATHVMTYTDNNAANSVNISGVPTTIATAPANTFFRGITWAPQPLPAAPTATATGVNFSGVAYNAATINWTNPGAGAGLGRVVVLSTSPVFSTPVPPLTANSVYTSGQQIVYMGTGTTVNVTNLSSNTQYYVKIYDQNNVNQSQCTYQFYPSTTTADANTTTPAVPAIGPSVNPLAFGNVAVNATSQLSFTLTGGSLTPNSSVTVTAPANFQISTLSGSGFGSTLNLTADGSGSLSQVIYVNFTPTAAIPYNGLVTFTNSTPGLVNTALTVTGTGVSPTLSLGAVSAFGNQGVNTYSSSQTLALSGTAVPGPVTITATGAFEVSTDCINFGSTATYTPSPIPPQGATLTNVPVYVHFKPAILGAASGSITATVTTATSNSAAVSGTGVTVPAAFTNGDITVLMMGNGCPALVGSAANPFSFLEYSTGGVASGLELQLPTAAGSWATGALTGSNNAGTEGHLDLSPDGTVLSFAGSLADVGTPGIANLVGHGHGTGVGYYSNTESYNYQSSATAFSAHNIRSSMADGCGNYWAVGDGVTTDAVYYFGSNFAQTGVTNGTNTVLRVGKIINGQMYVTLQNLAGQPSGIFKVGNGTPTSSGQTGTIFLQTGLGSVGTSPYGFAMNPTGNLTTAYIADDNSFNAVQPIACGGIQKYTSVNNGATWTFAYTLRPIPASTTGARALTVDWSGANPIIYAIAGNTASGNQLIKITDNGIGAVPIVLSASAPSGFNYKGVVFSPKPAIVAPTVQTNNLNFTPIVAASSTISWINGNGAGRVIKLIKSPSIPAFTPPVNGTTYVANTVYGGSGEQVIYAGSAGTTVTVTGLVNGQTYWVQGWEYNGSGCSIVYSTAVGVDNPSPNAHVWLGTTAGGNNWNIAGNWEAGVIPNSCNTSVFISSTAPNQPSTTSSVAVGNMDLGDGATVTLTGIATTLSVCGNWAGGANIASTIAGTGSVILTGGNAVLQQLYGRTKFQTLQLNSTFGAAMQAGSFFDIFVALELKTGAFNSSAGTLTFKSPTNASSGVLDNFSIGFTGTITGNIKTERGYAAPAFLSYSQHFMGSPVNSVPLTQFGAGGTGGYVTPLASCSEAGLALGSPYGPVFSMHEANGSSCVQQQWFVETGGNTTNGQGYSVLTGSGAGVLTLTGAPNINASYSVSGLANSNWNNTTAQGHTFASGWQLLSNPFLATLKLTTANAGFDSQIQIWNSSTGSYTPALVGSPAAVIPPFGTWLAHVTAPGGGHTYNINKSDLVRQVVVYNSLAANELKITAVNHGNNFADMTTVSFNPNATAQFDPQFDANKVSGALGRHNLYTLCNNHWMGINVLQSMAQTSTVPMGFDAQADGTYTLSFDGVNTFDETSYITLEDTKLNTFHDVRSGDYTFSALAADNWNRFVLHFTPAAVINTTDATCATTGNISVQQPGTANWNYTLTDIYSTTISSGTLNQTNPMTVNVPAGTYTLTLVDNNNYTVVKNIIVSGNQSVVAAFNASANTVQQNDNVTFTCTTPNATVYAWNFGDGTVANTQTVTHAFVNPATYTVALTVLDGSGCQSSISQIVTVTHRNATGINNITDGKLNIWSSDNTVYVDFSNQPKVDATIDIYNVLGQQLSSERFGSSSVYTKEISNLEAAYMMVRIKNDNETITKKVFISNNK